MGEAPPIACVAPFVVLEGAMRIPEHAARRLIEAPQGEVLVLVTETVDRLTEGLRGVDQAVGILKKLAERIDRMVEADAFEIEVADRVVLNAHTLVAAADEVLTALPEERSDVQAALATVARFARHTFERIAADEARHRAWLEFLDGDAPPSGGVDEPYSFERSLPMECTFCGKGQQEVRKLIAGPRCFICDECVRLCSDVIAEELERG